MAKKTFAQFKSLYSKLNSSKIKIKVSKSKVKKLKVPKISKKTYR